MELKMSLRDVEVDDSKLKDLTKHILQAAVQKGRELMVERTPARSEGPYSSGRLRESIRFERTGDLEYTYYVQVPYGAFVEFGTGPKGRTTGAWPEFPDDPQPSISYHTGEVFVTRWRGRLLEAPIIRHTQGMEAQPFLRPGLVEAMDVLKQLLKSYSKK